jgi:TRAP-type C4-dicarboxylate transport system substrate-binding protein
MGISGAIIGGAIIAGSAVSAREQRKARQAAERAAEEERQAIEALQREVQAEANKAPMPVPDDDAARRARRRSVSGLARRRGRQSTILTGDVSSDSLGG